MAHLESCGQLLLDEAIRIGLPELARVEPRFLVEEVELAGADLVAERVDVDALAQLRHRPGAPSSVRGQILLGLLLERLQVGLRNESIGDAFVLERNLDRSSLRLAASLGVIRDRIEPHQPDRLSGGVVFCAPDDSHGHHDQCGSAHAL
jgi:hypothetical protein